ncbi:parvalbumin, thymic-like [Neosynchiropus ocellatus]
MKVSGWSIKDCITCRRTPQSPAVLDLGGRHQLRCIMSIKTVLSKQDIDKAIAAFQDPDSSFCYKTFFQLCGLTSKSPDDIKIVFEDLDRDKSGFIEEPELEFFLQRFDDNARKLSESERQSIMAHADYDQDGKIGADEFKSLVEYSK